MSDCKHKTLSGWWTFDGTGYCTLCGSSFIFALNEQDANIAALEKVAWEFADPTITLSRKYELKKWLLENSDGGEHREWVSRNLHASGYGGRE